MARKLSALRRNKLGKVWNSLLPNLLKFRGQHGNLSPGACCNYSLLYYEAGNAINFAVIGFELHIFTIEKVLIEWNCIFGGVDGRKRAKLITWNAWDTLWLWNALWRLPAARTVIHWTWKCFCLENRVLVGGKESSRREQHSKVFDSWRICMHREVFLVITLRSKYLLFHSL